DALWISIAPNQYYSPIGRLRDRTERMHASVARFTSMLAREAAARGESLPRVLVSVHIANNYFAPAAQPERFARDIWGNEYPDIPDPRDEEFWETEVARPVEVLASEWPKHAAAEVPLAGIIVDLEMYLRHLTGVSEFSGTMGFGGGPLAPPRDVQGRRD